MPSATFIEHNGTEHAIEVSLGQSLMQAAVDRSVPGILGDCGGSCACATCHGYLDPAWAGAVAPAGDNERSLLEMVIEPRDNSRLLCQIAMTPALQGAVIRLPVSQT